MRQATANTPSLDSAEPTAANPITHWMILHGHPEHGAAAPDTLRSMSLAKLVPACVPIALAVAACGGSVANPVAGSASAAKGRGKVDNPRTNQPNHVACLRQDHLSVVSTSIYGRPGIQIGSPPSGPTVVFEPTPGVAQGDQMQGNRAFQGAEVIGSALLYPNAASDKELSKVEACIAQGVAG